MVEKKRGRQEHGGKKEGRKMAKRKKEKTDEEFDDAYSKMDKDSDGSVSFTEFKKYFNKILNDSSKSKKKQHIMEEEKM